MNLALLVNTHNLADIRAFVEAAVASQQDKAPGALAVVYQAKIGAEEIQELVAPLLAKFSAGVSIPVPINSSLGNDARNGTLFALFIAQGYARFPGPWLIVDGPALPKGDNFVTEVDKQHKLLGGPASGRITMDGPSMIPVGPVVIGLPVKKLTWFSPGMNESWRARARFLLGRCGFKVVPLQEYLFTVPSGIGEHVKSTPAPEIPVEPPTVEAYPDMGVTLGSTERMKSTLTEIRSEQAPKEVASTQPIDDDTKASPYDHFSKEDLLDLIELRDLPKPHHLTGVPKLVTILLDDDKAKKEALMAAHPETPEEQ